MAKGGSYTVKDGKPTLMHNTKPSDPAAPVKPAPKKSKPTAKKSPGA